MGYLPKLLLKENFSFNSQKIIFSVGALVVPQGPSFLRPRHRLLAVPAVRPVRVGGAACEGRSGGGGARGGEGSGAGPGFRVPWSG